jgi:gas vesicle protein
MVRGGKSQHEGHRRFQATAPTQFKKCYNYDNKFPNREEKEMNDCSSTGSKVTYFLIGGTIGAVIALLFAPRSGRETREIIANKALEGRDLLSSAGRNVGGAVSSYIDKGKEIVSTQKDQIAAAIEAGKQAYREEKAKAQSMTD